MSERYEPKSDFLKNFDFETVPLSGHEFGEANLRRLIALSNDEDSSNRDWATFFLATSEVVNEAVAEALLQRLTDIHGETRSEAVLGLAKRRHPRILNFLVEYLAGDNIGLMELEAAGSMADERLLPVLEELYSTWDSEPANDEHVETIKRAIAACRDGDAEKHGFLVLSANPS